MFILDFNVSFKRPDGKQDISMMTKTGTVAFSAPEVFGSSFYSQKVDVWAAGIVLYMMLCGHIPF